MRKGNGERKGKGAMRAKWRGGKGLTKTGTIEEIRIHTGIKKIGIGTRATKVIIHLIGHHGIIEA